MKRVFVICMLVSTIMYAGDKTEKGYVKGILVEVTVGQRTTGVPAGQGTIIAQHNVFQVSVRIGDLIYTGETRSKNVRQLVIGDPVDARVDDKNLYLRLPDGKEIKTKLLTKTRATKASSTPTEPK